MKQYKILIGSPVCQDNNILIEFLTSVKELDTENIDIHYYFVDDNKDEESSLILNEFKLNNNNVYLEYSDKSQEYIKNENTHFWNNSLIAKVARFKNNIIEYAKNHNFDFLFLIDSDLVLNPLTLKKLVYSKKDIISNIFWTQWSQDSTPLPQVWEQDFYSFYYKEPQENISNEEIGIRQNNFINKLKIPGIYRVGGLGACTLISKFAIEKGVNFNPIYNITFWGEDRSFCIRAVALGLELFVDTTFPAFHIYRQSELKNVNEYKVNTTNDILKNLEIESLKIINGVVDAVFDYSYEDFTINNLNCFFVDKESDRLTKLLEDNYESIIKNKIIQKANIIKYISNITDDINKLELTINVLLEGYKNNYSFKNNLEVKCICTKQEDFRILIESFDFKYLDTEDNYIVRRVLDKPKLTLSMIVKNDEHRYLRKVLESAREYIDNAVIIDDASTDNTVKLCKEVLEGIPLKIIENNYSKFYNETELRKQQWSETIAIDPDWILFLDSDELFEDSFKNYVQDLMKNKEIDSYAFRLYDFWDESHYRDDGLWSAHKFYRIFMTRYQPNYEYEFLNTPQHCGRLPLNLWVYPNQCSNLRLKHLGWSKEEDRIKKYERYMKLDPNGIYGSLVQYESILDESVNLIEFED